MILDSELQETTLEVVGGLPLPEVLLRCNTKDQEAHWFRLKAFYQGLYQSLKDYFGGRPAQHSHLSAADREFYGFLRDSYLAFYKVIQWGWSYIEEDAESRGVLENLRSCAASPGEALLRVLKDDCDAFMQPAFLPLHRWSPSDLRDMRKLDKEISAVIQSGESLSQKSKNKLRKYEQKLKQARQPSAIFTYFQTNCLTACKANQAKDRTLRRYLDEYRDTLDRLGAEMARRYHPSKGLRGEEWQHGYKKTLGQHGGI